MNRDEQNSEALLDNAIDAVRGQTLDETSLDASRRRVWDRLSEGSAMRGERLTGCEDFQRLFALYRAGSLDADRKMLLEDHVNECVACRRALHGEVKAAAPGVVEMPRRRPAIARWAAAAAVVVGVAGASWYGWQNFGPAPAGARATVLAATGEVYRLNGATLVPAGIGAQLADREVLRTGGGAHASVRLQDGSVVEVSERAAFSVSATRRDTTVHLDRGQIIVEAAKRRTGHLYVASADSRVSVTGTVFSVNRGFKGSRVSVVEGEVHVDHNGGSSVLHAGDQVSTNAAIGKTAITDEIAWSRNFDQHLAMLRQFTELKGKLEQVRLPGLRYGSRLLDSVPEGTTAFVSVPNVGRAISDVQRIIKDQAAASPELQTMLRTQMPEFEKVASHLSQVSEYLGEEVVVAFQPCKGFCGVLIAEVHRPGLREYLEKLNDGDLNKLRFEFPGNRMVVGEQAPLVEAAVRGGSRFSQTPFGQKIGDAYKRGVGSLLAADLEAIMIEAKQTDDGFREFAGMGMDDARLFLAELRESGNQTQYSASVGFAGARRGIAAWLAEPGPMGSLSFIGPDAQFAASFVVKDAARVLREVLAFADGPDRSRLTLQEFESVTGIRLEDLAHALGGEFTFAFDGPLLPTPAWKLIVEVKDPASLQAAIEKGVAAGNQKLRENGQPAVELTSERVEQRNLTVHGLRFPGATVAEAHYAFADGYLVAAPTTALLQVAVANRASGVTLAQSRGFTDLLPRDGRAHFSGMLYQNAGELIRLFAKNSGAVSGVTPQQQNEAEALASKVEPMLMALYGEGDRIEVASQGSAINLLMQSMAAPLLAPKVQGTQKTLRSYR